MDQNTKRILIVDDSAVQAIFLRRIFTQAKYETLTAKDGVEAIEQIETNDVDIVVSDINMPNMDGYELCKKIKSNPDTYQIPVILCTILSTPQALIKGLEVGADSYITRPYNEEQLLKLINELLVIPQVPFRDQEKSEIIFDGQNYSIKAQVQHIINFLMSTYRNIHQQNLELNNLREEIQKAYSKLELTQKEQESILLNILPESVANELIAFGSVKPIRMEKTTVMFVDFKGFSLQATKMTPQDLVQALGSYFDQFDKIIESCSVERIKTIGDGYMCASGVPLENANHAVNCVKAALDIQKFIRKNAQQFKEKYNIEWTARIGIHSGPVVAGVVGKKRFAYDIWGETVNLASRMESHGIAGEINISKSTYDIIKNSFKCTSRGEIPIKNKEGVEAVMEMFLVDQDHSS